VLDAEAAGASEEVSRIIQEALTDATNPSGQLEAARMPAYLDLIDDRVVQQVELAAGKRSAGPLFPQAATLTLMELSPRHPAAASAIKRLRSDRSPEMMRRIECAEASIREVNKERK
jgi:hypothetical protein